MDHAKWAKAQAEYETGASLASICKKYKITMAALIKRIKAEGWRRPGEKPKTTLPVPASAQERTDTVRDKVAQAAAEVIEGHRSISREIRENLDSELAEYQELKQYTLSITDKARIQELQAQCEPGKPNKELVDYLYGCFDAFAKRVQSIDKLVRLAALIITTERAVWGLDKAPDGEETLEYDDLLEICQQQMQTRQLPPNVADFEAKLRDKRGG